MDWKKNFETTRLQLRPFIEKDQEPFKDLVADRQVERFLSMPTLAHLKQTKHLKDYTLFETPKPGHGLTLLIREKENEEFVGIIGLRPAEDKNEYRLFCTLGPQYWLKGYAKEAGNVVIKYGFEEMQAEAIHGSAEGSNLASVNFLNSLGMRLNTGDKPSPNSSIKPFEITKEDYRRRSMK
ncbi:GNAT family N-acetyltransferase [Persicobacter psychrovividus]|uniref:Acetyltransferase n=1 Tax=Persicobacter psychrovividus TaxID=387638 RepID=A0ABN6LC76_9BACT|nr:acetyltransferase [Persicobacter psychrovividus]